MTRYATPVATLLVVLLVSACAAGTDRAGTTGESTQQTATLQPTTSTTQAPALLSVTDAWASPSVPGATVGAVFLVVANPTPEPDALVAAVVDTSVARAVQLQLPAAPGGGDEDAAPGPATAVVVHGSQVQRLEVPAGSTVTFDHGSGHLVLVGLARPIVAGDVFPMSLQFENAGPVAITVTVRDG